jgi:hypothetical protein
MTLLHPAHLMLLATTRHRELVADAESYRMAARTGGSPQSDCRIPSPAVPQPQPCRPDPRQAAACQPASRRPGYALRGHRKPRAVR